MHIESWGGDNVDISFIAYYIHICKTNLYHTPCEYAVYMPTSNIITVDYMCINTSYPTYMYIYIVSLAKPNTAGLDEFLNF
jgi:hypothetical protein